MDDERIARILHRIIILRVELDLQLLASRCLEGKRLRIPAARHHEDRHKDEKEGQRFLPGFSCQFRHIYSISISISSKKISCGKMRNHPATAAFSLKFIYRGNRQIQS